MIPPTDSASILSRRRFLHATAASVLTAAVAPARRTSARAAVAGAPTADPDFGALDAKIQAGMARYGIPGVAVGVLAQGTEYVRGYGVTNVAYPAASSGPCVGAFAGIPRPISPSWRQTYSSSFCRPRKKAQAVRDVSHHTFLSFQAPSDARHHTVTLQDTMPSRNRSVEHVVYAREQHRIIMQAVQTLEQRSGAILIQQHGLDGQGGMSLAEMGRARGLSRERVRQIAARATAQLRGHPILQALAAEDVRTAGHNGHL